MADSACIHAFLEFFLPVLCTIFFPSHWLLSNITIVETTDSSERGMDPVSMTIIHPRKENMPSQGSNQRPPVLKSAMLPTKLWGLATVVRYCTLAVMKQCMHKWSPVTHPLPY